MDTIILTRVLPRKSILCALLLLLIGGVSLAAHIQGSGSRPYHSAESCSAKITKNVLILHQAPNIEAYFTTIELINYLIIQDSWTRHISEDLSLSWDHTFALRINYWNQSLWIRLRCRRVSRLNSQINDSIPGGSLSRIGKGDHGMGLLADGQLLVERRCFNVQIGAIFDFPRNSSLFKSALHSGCLYIRVVGVNASNYNQTETEAKRQSHIGQFKLPKLFSFFFLLLGAVSALTGLWLIIAFSVWILSQIDSLDTGLGADLSKWQIAVLRLPLGLLFLCLSFLLIFHGLDIFEALPLTDPTLPWSLVLICFSLILALGCLGVRWNRSLKAGSKNPLQSKGER